MDFVVDSGHVNMVINKKRGVDVAARIVGSVDVEITVMGDVDRRFGVEVQRKITCRRGIHGNCISLWLFDYIIHKLDYKRGGEDDDYV